VRGVPGPGHRHLQGCYADIDGVESTVAVLARPDAAALAPVSIRRVSLPPHAEVLAASGVPYYSQWESPELVPRFLDGSLSAADDPNWAVSGARTPAEYGFWASRVCGLACLRMVLDGRGMPVPPMMPLVERALTWKAYIRDGDRVAGLIYKPFADWVGHDYGISATVVPDLTLEQVCASASPATPVIASVHHWIRWPNRIPPQTGGHLVLVTGAAGGVLRLHNPSGLPGASQRDALVQVTDFARFFAGRGLIVDG
jgi:Peptidase_C39 like family